MYEEVEMMGPMVAKIIDIVGPRVMVLRRYPTSGVVSIQAYVGMPIFKNDHIKTDTTSNCCAEYLIGGRALIGASHECVQKLWNKIDKQKAQLQIQTNGGVIGIEG